MNTELFERIRREVALTVVGARETILALADRVNRKTQAIKLHWHASEVSRQISVTHQQIGLLVSEELAKRDQPGHGPASLPSSTDELQGRLEGLAATLRLLKQELVRIDRRIAEIETENLSDDLLKLQLDLTGRSLSIERLTVVADAPAVEVPVERLALSSGTRVVAVFRGPALLADHLTSELRSGDIVVLLGPRADLQKDRSQFTERPRATA